MIKIENLSKFYGKTQVLNQISFELTKQKIYSILGPNGSGKTTVFKCLLGLTQVEKNSKLLLSDKAIEFNLPAYLNVGYMPQSPFFQKNLKVKELLEYLKSLEKTFPVHFRKLYTELGVQSFEEKKIFELSGGMKQKLNILQCFMSNRDIYFLDEPTASLDPYHSIYLKELILNLKQNSTIVLTTHILHEVEELADEMLILIDGKLKYRDNPKEFIKKQDSENLEKAIGKIKEFIKI